MLNDEWDEVNMDNADNKIGGKQIPIPELQVLHREQYNQTQSSHVQDDKMIFYKGMSFKNKEELVVLLKLSCLKKDLDSRR